MTEQDETKAFFGRRIEENMGALYGMALRLTGSGADAEDLVADSVAKAWSAIATLKDRNRFRPWMFRILHNCFVSDYRKKSVRPVESSYVEDCDDSVATLLNEQTDEYLIWWANPELQFFNNMLGDAIVAAMDSLPEVFRTTIVLINIEGLTYDETAEVLGVPQGTIRSRMKRGRTLLQKALWEQARDAGLTSDDGE